MINKGLFTSDKQDWETPQDLYDKLDGEFNFTLDPCASHENHKCKKYYTIEDDGLSKSWLGETVFMNPPYGREIGDWVKKAYSESRSGKATVVGLLPARTDTKWFHNYCYLYDVEIRFLKGRIKFSGSKNSAPFPSMVVIYSSINKQSKRMSEQ